MWEAVKQLYEERTSLVDLHNKLENTHRIEGGNVRDHFQELANLRQQLAAMGDDVPESEYASTLMVSLPRSYYPTLHAIAVA